LDENFDSIVKAILWGRNTFEGVKKFIQFQLTINFSLTILTLIGAAVIKQPILSSIQMLWVNLFMDTLGALALATDFPEASMMDRKPYSKKDYIISKVINKIIAK
jgi:Ca2+ transporting ATPase